MSNVEQTVAEAVAQVKASEDRLKGLLADQAREIQQTRTTSDATVEKIKGVEVELKSALEAAVAASAKVDKDNVELRDRVVELEKSAKRVGFGQPEPAPQKSLGERFVEMLKETGDGDRLRRGARGSQGIEFKSIEDEMVRQKANLVTSDATRFAPPMRDAMLLPNNRVLTLADLLQRVPTTSNAIEYVQILGFGPEATQSVTAIPVSGTTATLQAAAPHGWVIGDYIEVAGATGGVAADDAKHNKVFRIATVPDTTHVTYAIESGATNGPSGTLVARKMRGGAAAGRSEGSAAAESRMKAELKTASVYNISHFLPVSRQALDDIAQLQSIVNNELLYGVDRERERQLLYGSGSAPELPGIMTHLNVQTYTGATPDLKLDALRRAITRVQLSEFAANGAVVNPLDWEDMELAKGDNGQYVWVQVPTGGGSTVWRLPVVVTASILEGDGLVGAFDLGATLYDREQANVRFSEHHASYFISGMLALLGDSRCAVAWKRPEAFVAIDFGTAV